VFATLAAIEADALAEPSADDVERARTFFNAGAQAYGAAKYADAVRSFEQAEALAPRPPILFSLAQAERKEFLEHGSGTFLKHAIQHYKDYLEQMPSGGRRSEAIEAKADLEARLGRMDPSQLNAAPAPTERHKPRVTVFSPTPGARASLDNGPSQELPYFADLEPGKHKVRVFGDGYVEAEQEISGDKGIDVPVNLPLKEKPALVSIELESTAQVFVDGRLVADAPVRRAIEVPSGVHVIAIAKNGRRAFSQEVTLVRGKPLTVHPKLVTSTQRYVAWGLLGAGAASVVTGAVLAVVAFGAESHVQDLDDKRQHQNLTAKELDDHNQSIDRRDAFRSGSIVASAAGIALLAGGALFWTVDTPPVALVPPRSVEPGRQPEMPLEVTASLRPILAPGLYGAGLSGRF
jgi:hypothetical protein